ncbi:Extracellular signal-regulated kinase 7 [Pseudolycoriella hygida]|uniref:Mitogen-activated protein kinase n=1 Tax=Pseudolycoriella hygida TaxID=35572 RepID=A0A9Q0MW86_9DIPT|nr:Extracellular signal-regulated kinase 7 [Pseudolycoriella hygida]
MPMKPKNQDKIDKIAEIDDKILKNFDIKKRLGKGAYGIVWKATDKRTQQIVAVKKIFDAFRNETDAQRTFREIMFLTAFRNHPNVIQLQSIHRAFNNMDIYLSFECMDSDLHNVIKRGSILKDIHKRYVMYQLLNAMLYIHSGNVCHRDMKPSNCLIDSKCRCKIADFGLARSVSHSQSGRENDVVELCLTDYVATRWYRAPELLVASKKYTLGIDMWSLGCILGEMIRGKPLFPGSCSVNQVERIVAAMPHITEEDVKSVGSGFGSVLLSKSNSKLEFPNLDELLLGSPEDAKHLVKSLLVLDPVKRLSAKQALHHKYVEKFRYKLPELELNQDIIPIFRDDVQLSVTEYRTKLYDIMTANEKVNGIVGKIDKKDIEQLEATLTVTGAQRRNDLTKAFESNGRHLIEKKLIANGDSKQASVKKMTKKPSESLLQNLCSRVTTTKQILSKSEQRLSRDQHVNHGSQNGRSVSQLGNRSSGELHKLHSSALRKASLDNPDSRQSFDSGLNTDPSRNNRSSPEDDARNNCLIKVIPSMSKQKIMQILQNRDHSISHEKYRKNSDKMKKTRANFEYRDKSSHLNPEEYYEAKLKNLEDRIRKHNNNVKSFNCSADKIGMSNDVLKKKTNAQDCTKTIKPLNARTKSDATNLSASNVKIPVKIILSGYTPADEGYCGRFSKDTNSYGVIRATDLYKLKSSELL